MKTAIPSDNRILKSDLKIESFSTSEEFSSWLEKNHNVSSCIWIRFFKKTSGLATITYAEALDAALCYGWIDSQKNAYDKDSWLQKFTPRKPKSIWSKRNREHVERLTASGLMKEAGMKEIEAAKSDGRWEQAYDSPANMIVPEDFLMELAKDQDAEAFFCSLNKTNTFSIVWRLQTAKKPETRERRIKTIITMLKKGETFH